MKFKNYRNSHNNDSKIYSEDDIWNMPVSQVFGLENEILAQNRQIGIPDMSELQAPDNVIWIDSYTRDDGTKVEGHWRSLPDDAHYKMSDTASNVHNSAEQRNVDNNKTIAGIKAGKPMLFEEAADDSINPEYYSGKEEYFNNCQSCVVAYEARRRGYNVQAAAQDDEGKILELSYNPFAAWIDKEENPCKGETINAKNPEECLEWLDKKIKTGERYAFVYYTERKTDEKYGFEGHEIVLDRDNNNQLRWYDPQSNSTRNETLILGKLKAVVNFSGEMLPQILQIDDKKFNPYFIDEVVRGKE